MSRLKIVFAILWNHVFTRFHRRVNIVLDYREPSICRIQLKCVEWLSSKYCGQYALLIAQWRTGCARGKTVCYSLFVFLSRTSHGISSPLQIDVLSLGLQFTLILVWYLSETWKEFTQAYTTTHSCDCSSHWWSTQVYGDVHESLEGLRTSWMRRLSHFVQRQLVIDIVSTKGQRVMYKLSYLSHWFSVDVLNK